MPLVLLLENYKLGIVITPKVASTTMIKFSMSLSGVEIGDQNARKYARHNAKFLQEKRGLIQMVVPSSDVRKFSARHANYKWVAVTRNPYSRALSGYKSKVQRYAREYKFGTYVWTGILKLIKGPKAWDDSRVHAEEVAKRIPFGEFLSGLQSHGLNWDGHFQLQADILALSEMHYDLLIKQEELPEGIVQLAQLVGIPAGSAPRVSFSNVSLNQKFGVSSLTVEEREVICNLYQKDFELLGYEP